MKITVLIRVYDRVEDLKCNLNIISDTWTENNYFIIVVSNGKSHGYNIPKEYIQYIDKLVILEENAGHIKGNSQLLMEGQKYIPEDSEYTLILEADTWMYKDNLITKYTKLLSESRNAVWASADWLDKFHNLGTDFAIIKTSYLKENPAIFNFEQFPESYISSYLHQTNSGYIWITENMPVHVPSYVIKYPYIINNERRFYIFPKSRMVTHHIEYLTNGVEDKKRYFNIVADYDYFDNIKVKRKAFERFKINFWMNLSQCFIKRSWYKKKIYNPINNVCNKR